MLGLALQLRAQLEPAGPARPSAPPDAAGIERTAHRWRVELGEGMRYVLQALRLAAKEEPELQELARSLDFNGYVCGSRE